MIHPRPQSKKAVIYFTPGCSKCRAAEEFFLSRGVEIEMVNVAGDFGALRRMARVCGGSRTVPVIEYGGQIRIGFNPRDYGKRLEGDV